MPQHRRRAPLAQMASDPTTSETADHLAIAGDTGLRRSGGLVLEEYARALRGRRGVEQFTEMADSPLVGAFLLTVDMLARGAGVKVVAAIPGDERAEAEAEHMRTVMADMDVPWGVAQSEALFSALVYGWHRAEMLFKLRRGPDAPIEELRSKHSDGRWGLADLSPRAADSLDRWEWDPKRRDRVIGMHQMIVGGEGGCFYVPEAKMLAFVPRNRGKRSPEGYSTLRSGHRNWAYARKAEDDEIIGLDKDMTGVVVQQLPLDIMAPSATPEKLAVRRSYEQTIVKLRRGRAEGMVVPTERDANDKPTGYLTKPFPSGGQGRVMPDPVVRRHESRLLMSLLSEYMELGTGGSTGSRAVADPKLNQLQLALEGLLESYDEAVNNTVIRTLYTLDGVPQMYWPRIEHEAVDTPTAAEVITQLVQMSGAGLLVPSRKLQRHALELALGDEAAEIGDELDDETETDAGDVAGEAAPLPIGGAAPPAAAAVAGGVPAAETALNGAQVTSAVEIVGEVAAGRLPRSTGVAMLQEFFNLAPARAERIMGEVGAGFVPTAEAAAGSAPASPTGAPPPAGA
jgi:hypothetical protein